MGKILLFLAVAVIGWLFVKWLLKKPDADAARDASKGGPEQMVKCDLCGVFMPESDSAQLDGKRTCQTPQRCLHRQSA